MGRCLASESHPIHLIHYAFVPSHCGKKIHKGRDPQFPTPFLLCYIRNMLAGCILITQPWSVVWSQSCTIVPVIIIAFVLDSKVPLQLCTSGV